MSVYYFLKNPIKTNVIFLFVADRKHLESQITAKAKGRPKRNTKAPAIVDIVDEVDEADENADPYDFEPSATDWAPSDENLSDSEFEVCELKTNLTSKTCFNFYEILFLYIFFIPIRYTLKHSS